MTATIVCFGEKPANCDELQDGEFLKSIRWSRTAPKALTQAAKAGDTEKFCRALKESRCTVRPGGGLKRVASFAATRPAQWSLPAFEASSRAAELLQIFNALDEAGARAGKKMGASEPAPASLNGNGTLNGTGKPPRGKQKKNKKRSRGIAGAEAPLGEWLSDVQSGGPLHPFELLIVNELLLAYGRDLSSPLLWRLWRTAITAAAAFQDELPEPQGSETPGERQLLLAGELPFQNGLMFAGVKGAAALRRQSAKLLTTELLDATDTDGTPHAEHIENLPLWLAPYVRAKVWSDGFGEPVFSEEADERFRDLIAIVALMCRADGRMALGNGCYAEEAPKRIPQLLAIASTAAGLSRKSGPRRYLADLEQFSSKGKSKRPSLRKNEKAKSKKSARKNRDGEHPVAQSDWAQLACLRSDWSLAADTVVVAHHSEMPGVDLSACGVPLISGTWELELTLDGEPIETAGDWTCSCWFSDNDADYIEVQNSLDNGIIIDRQVLLSRTDHFALFADCISGASAEARLEYTQRLPVLAETTLEADVPTRECRLKRNGLLARAFPLALDSDRVRSTPGQLGNETGGLELRQSAVGGLYAPLLLDWSPKRKRAYAEWRKLTVAEDGRRLTSADASGHRIRLGNQHLFIFRNLTKGVFSRSVLGHHTNHESIIGRFQKDGRVTPILLVE